MAALVLVSLGEGIALLLVYFTQDMAALVLISSGEHVASLLA